MGGFALDPYFESQLIERCCSRQFESSLTRSPETLRTVSAIDSDPPSVFQRLQPMTSEEKQHVPNDNWVGASTIRDSAVAELLASYQRKQSAKRCTHGNNLPRRQERPPSLLPFSLTADGNFSSTSEEWTGRSIGNSHGFDFSQYALKKYPSSRSTSESRVNLTAASYMLDNRRVTANFGCAA